MIINLIWANNALAAPQTFREGVQTAAKTCKRHFSTKSSSTFRSVMEHLGTFHCPIKTLPKVTSGLPAITPRDLAWSKATQI
jgi:hypothetical protein